mgnify:CR=1 FL=1
MLSKAHQLRELKNPCQDPKVKELLAMTRRAHAKRGALPKRKDALTKDPLQAILATCDDSLRGKRDRALLLFGDGRVEAGPTETMLTAERLSALYQHPLRLVESDGRRAFLPL